MSEDRRRDSKKQFRSPIYKQNKSPLVCQNPRDRFASGLKKHSRRVIETIITRLSLEDKCVGYDKDAKIETIASHFEHFPDDSGIVNDVIEEFQNEQTRDRPSPLPLPLRARISPIVKYIPSPNVHLNNDHESAPHVQMHLSPTVLPHEFLPSPAVSEELLPVPVPMVGDVRPVARVLDFTQPRMKQNTRDDMYNSLELGDMDGVRGKRGFIMEVHEEAPPIRSNDEIMKIGETGFVLKQSDSVLPSYEISTDGDNDEEFHQDTLQHNSRFVCSPVIMKNRTKNPRPHIHKGDDGEENVVDLNDYDDQESPNKICSGMGTFSKNGSDSDSDLEPKSGSVFLGFPHLASTYLDTEVSENIPSNNVPVAGLGKEEVIKKKGPVDFGTIDLNKEMNKPLQEGKIPKKKEEKVTKGPVKEIQQPATIETETFSQLSIDEGGNMEEPPFPKEFDSRSKSYLDVNQMNEVKARPRRRRHGIKPYSQSSHGSAPSGFGDTSPNKFFPPVEDELKMEHIDFANDEDDVKEPEIVEIKIPRHRYGRSHLRWVHKNIMKAEREEEELRNDDTKEMEVDERSTRTNTSDETSGSSDSSESSPEKSSGEEGSDDAMDIEKGDWKKKKKKKKFDARDIPRLDFKLDLCENSSRAKQIQAKQNKKRKRRLKEEYLLEKHPPPKHNPDLVHFLGKEENVAILKFYCEFFANHVQCVERDPKKNKEHFTKVNHYTRLISKRQTWRKESRKREHFIKYLDIEKVKNDYERWKKAILCPPTSLNEKDYGMRDGSDLLEREYEVIFPLLKNRILEDGVNVFIEGYGSKLFLMTKFMISLSKYCQVRKRLPAKNIQFLVVLGHDSSVTLESIFDYILTKFMEINKEEFDDIKVERQRLLKKVLKIQEHYQNINSFPVHEKRDYFYDSFKNEENILIVLFNNFDRVIKNDENMEIFNCLVNDANLTNDRLEAIQVNIRWILTTDGEVEEFYLGWLGDEYSIDTFRLGILENEDSVLRETKNDVKVKKFLFSFNEMTNKLKAVTAVCLRMSWEYYRKSNNIAQSKTFPKLEILKRILHMKNMAELVQNVTQNTFLRSTQNGSISCRSDPMFWAILSHIPEVRFIADKYMKRIEKEISKYDKEISQRRKKSAAKRRGSRRKKPAPKKKATKKKKTRTRK